MDLNVAENAGSAKDLHSDESNARLPQCSGMSPEGSGHADVDAEAVQRSFDRPMQDQRLLHVLCLAEIAVKRECVFGGERSDRLLAKDDGNRRAGGLRSPSINPDFAPHRVILLTPLWVE